MDTCNEWRENICKNKMCYFVIDCDKYLGIASGMAKEKLTRVVVYLNERETCIAQKKAKRLFYKNIHRLAASILRPHFHSTK